MFCRISILAAFAGLLLLFASPIFGGRMSEGRGAAVVGHYMGFWGQANFTTDSGRSLSTNDSVVCSASFNNCHQAVKSFPPGTFVSRLDCRLSLIGGTHDTDDKVDACVIAHEEGERSDDGRSLGCLEIGGDPALSTTADGIVLSQTINGTLTATETGVSVFLTNGADTGSNATVNGNCMLFTAGG